MPVEIPQYGVCPDYQNRVFALQAISHESQHLAGIQDEATAECNGMQKLGWFAQGFGATADQARQMAYDYYTTFYIVKRPGTPYYLPGCPNPAGDPYTGTSIPAAEAHFFRLDVVFAGLLNPPGPLGSTFDPFRFRASPPFGFLDIDVDPGSDTGGEMSLLKEIAEFPPALKFREDHTKVQVDATEKVNGHDAYRVIGLRPDGSAVDRHSRIMWVGSFGAAISGITARAAAVRGCKQGQNECELSHWRSSVSDEWCGRPRS